MKFPLLQWHMICEEISFLLNVDKPRFCPPNVRTSEPRNHTHKFSSTNIRKHLLGGLQCSDAQYTRGGNGAQWESFSGCLFCRRGRVTVKYICVTG